MEVRDELHAPATLLPKKETPYPLYRKLGGLQSCEEGLLPLPEIEPRLPCRRARSLVAIPASTVDVSVN
jgi:hypothetical protein